MRQRIWLAVGLLTLGCFCGKAFGRDDDRRSWNIGFFEAGDYPAHAELRLHFSNQLPALLPAGFEAVTVPQGFKSAGWVRDSSRLMAAQLTADTSVHLVVAMGPWTVEDLLAAGFDRPIIAACRFDPMSEGLADRTGRPTAENLTVRILPRRLETDLAAVATLAHPKRLGLLFFPSGDEAGRVVEQARRIGASLGFEVVTAEGYNNKNTYAFFKAAAALPKHVDALYLGPLWGFNSDKARQFYTGLLRDRIAAFSCEGERQVLWGAMAAGSGEAVEVTAFVEAWKAARIMQGVLPADLPTVVTVPGTPWINQYIATALGASLPPDLWLQANVVTSPPADDVERLSLPDALDRALIQNPDYQSRKDILQAAAGAARVAASAYLPQVQLDASAFRADRNTVHNDDRYDASRYQASVSVEQQLFSLETVRDIHVAGVDRDLTQRDLDQAALDLELAVTTAYLEVQRLYRVEQIAANCRTALTKAMQAAQARSALGDDRYADILRLDCEYRKSLKDQVDARSDLQVARILLNTLLGRPGPADFVATTEGPSADLMLERQARLQQQLNRPGDIGKATDFLMTQAVESSPAIDRARLSLRRQELALSRNSAQFLPQIGLHGRIGLVDERHESPTFEERHPTWTVGASLSLPLFPGGRRLAERRQLGWELQSLQYRRDDAYLRMSGEIQTYLSRMYAMATGFALMSYSSEKSSEYVRCVIAEYATGSRSVMEMVDAARNEYQTALDILAARTGYMLAAAHINHHVGWHATVSQASPDQYLLKRLRTLAADSGR